MHPLEYYSRKEIQKMIVGSSLHREVAINFGDKGFGKRPDTLNYESDVLELAKQGATSFHISEEHWKNPRSLTPGMTKRQLDDIRMGWDLILDIDSPNLEHSKVITYYLVQALKFHNIQHVSVKYSGNKGFHIGVPFRSFPQSFNEKSMKSLFPDAPRIMAEYLTNMIKDHVSKKLTGEDIDEILKVDTVLISSRHLFRAPYSLHEKSGLVSLPINPEEILNFDKTSATPEKVEPKIKFLDKSEENDAIQLIKSAYEWNSEINIRKKAIEEEEITVTREYDEISEAIPEEFFPEEMKLGLKGMKDGKKRFLFILINFLKCVGWSHEDINKRVKEWNQNNPEPLKEGYIISQLMWHKRQKDKILPPNYSNNSYYRDLGLNPPENVQRKFKNPVTYAAKMFRMKRKKRK
jgi:DNA primase catalytic subunit